MLSLKVVILKNETFEDHLNWLNACEQLENIECITVDLTKAKWLQEISSYKFDFLLARPPGGVGYFKELYDERLYTLNKVLGYKIYPTFEECKVYENKRMLAYLLKAKKIQHPETSLFYFKDEAMDFSENCNFPVVGKTAIGAGGSGVQILKNQSQLNTYIEQAFGKGLTRSWGPNMRKGDKFERLKNRLTDIPGTIQYFNQRRKKRISNPQRGYVILQEYIQSDHEWRCVAIGDSYFGHKKLRSNGEIMSGTSAVSWDLPPARLLDFVEDVMQKTGFYSQAVDVFESKAGEFYVNELQAFWGSKNPHQMLRDETPGRYRKKNGKWEFEEGEFNQLNSYKLRLKHALRLYNEKNL